MRDDCLLAALAEARHRREQAGRDTRLLLAYARELVAPRPYRLADLAEAAGLSVSGIRTAYDRSDTEQAAAKLTLPGGGDFRAGTSIAAAVSALLSSDRCISP